MLSADVPVLDSERLCAELVVPTRCNAKVSDEGDRDALGAAPVPDRLSVPPALAGEPVVLRDAEIAPAIAGENTALIVHDVPAAMDAGQLFVWINSGRLIVN